MKKILLFLILAVPCFSQSKVVIMDEKGQTLTYEFKGPIRVENMKITEAVKQADKLTVRYLDDKGKPVMEVFIGKLPEIVDLDKISEKVSDAKKKP